MPASVRLATDLRNDVQRLEKELDTAKKRLEAMVEECRQSGHAWGKEEYTPEHIAAYTIPGDPPGIMGLDRRGPVEVPPQTIKKWTRVCTRCLHKEVAGSRKETITRDVPSW